MSQKSKLSNRQSASRIDAYDITQYSKTVHNLFNSWYIGKLFPVNYTEYAAEYNCLMKYQNRREVTNDL